jgi:3-dehydroquinate synthase
MLEASSLAALRSDAALLGEVVRRSIAVKCEIVAADPYEKGLRRVLNLGHTLAHAIESLSAEYTHGEAVAVGLVWAARLSAERGVLPAEEAERICAVVEKYALPTSTTLSHEQLLEAMEHDKKSLSGRVKIVLPESVGKCIIADL